MNLMHISRPIFRGSEKTRKHLLEKRQYGVSQIAASVPPFKKIGLITAPFRSLMVHKRVVKMFFSAWTLPYVGKRFHDQSFFAISKA
jgi:hypothetical protein